MPSGGTVTVMAENCDVRRRRAPGVGAGEDVRICVADTGSGISAEHLEKVLEPFFTTKEVGKGSGLGLSMVYGFAKQSNGAFRLESEVGREREPSCGSRALLDRRSDRPSGPRTTSRTVAPAEVLLVDDHPEVRTTTAALLEDCGHQVHRPKTAQPRWKC